MISQLGFKTYYIVYGASRPSLQNRFLCFTLFHRSSRKHKANFPKHARRRWLILPIWQFRNWGCRFPHVMNMCASYCKMESRGKYCLSQSRFFVTANMQTLSQSGLLKAKKIETLELPGQTEEPEPGSLAENYAEVLADGAWVLDSFDSEFSGWPIPFFSWPPQIR